MVKGRGSKEENIEAAGVPSAERIGSCAIIVLLRIDRDGGRLELGLKTCFEKKLE